MDKFNYDIYLYNYNDIFKIFSNNKLGAYNHWEKYGIKEGRVCDKLIIKSEDKDEYENMNWKIYLLNNNIDKIYTTHDDAFIHWVKYGKNEGKTFYRNNKLINKTGNKKNVYIIAGITAGGTGKYLNDIVNNYKNNINFYFLKSNNDLKKYIYTENDIIFLQHLLGCTISINDIINIKNVYKSKLVISIHDCYWLNEVILKNFDKNVSCHSSYLKNKININQNIIKLFELSDDIIHPSMFTYNIYSKYIKNNNFRLVSHNDYPIDYTTKNIPLIKNNTINIGVLHAFSECKGKLFINYLQKIKNYNGYNIVWKIVGLNISKYNEEEFFTYIDNYNIHCLTLLNKWGETWCYSLTKFINSGLPIIYNNFGAFKERIPLNVEHYFKVFENENESESKNLYKLELEYIKILDYIITNNGKYNNINTNTTIIYNEYYNNLFL
jgi:hypothetical protein